MSQYLELSRAAESGAAPPSDWDTDERPFQVVSVVSNKGGVGKTTIASNLAVYLRAIREDLPILVVSFDDQPLIDWMFALDHRSHPRTIATALRSGSLRPALRLGQYGVHYVPTSAEIGQVKREIEDSFHLRGVLQRTNWRGVIIIDTKSDLEILTRNAIAASDLSIVCVKDQPSLGEAQKVFDLLRNWRRSREHARVLLSLVDLRVKFRGSEQGDILSHLIGAARSRDFPIFESFMSSTPKIESLHTNPEGRALSVLHGAPNSLVHAQLRHLADEVLESLGARVGACSAADPLRYRLGHGARWDVVDGDRVLADLRQRHPEFFERIVDPTTGTLPNLEALRANLEREPVDRRNYDALNAIAIGYFEISHRAEAERVSGLRYLGRSFRSAKLAGLLWLSYGRIRDERLRDAILDFFEDMASGQKLGSLTAARRLAEMAVSIERQEEDATRLARIRSVVAALALKGGECDDIDDLRAAVVRGRF